MLSKWFHWAMFVCAVSAVPGIEWSVWQSQGGQGVPGAAEELASADTGNKAICYVSKMWKWCKLIKY